MSNCSNEGMLVILFFDEVGQETWTLLFAMTSDAASMQPHFFYDVTTNFC